MGRAARWFKGLFGMKKSKETQGRVSGGDYNLPVEAVFLTDTEKEQNKQAIAVATAAASAAQAAVASAQAAAAMVRQTSDGRAGNVDIIAKEERWAAVQIQKVFRGSLARKALRALKGIVKLQALVRGYLVRKRAAAMLQSIQALIRVQTAMRSKRINRCLNKEYNNNMFQPRQSIDTAVYDQRSSKIVDIDETYKRRSKSRQVHNVVAMSEGEEYGGDLYYQGSDLELSFPEEKRKYATAHSTPRFSSLSRHHAVNNSRYYVTQSPANSVCGKALCDYGSILNSRGYMENTQSFKAKVRSHSAPRQRSERKRLSLDEEVMASRSSVSSGLSLVQQQRNSCSYDRF